MSYLFGTEHYEMVLKAGDMERVPAPARLAPRGPARRPELPELLRRPAREQVRQGRALRRRRRRAVRRLPVALLPRGRQRRLRPLRRQVLRLLAAPAPDDALRARASPRSGARGRRRPTARHLPRRLRPRTPTRSTRPEDYVNHSLYFEAKTFLHGLLVVEDKLTMAHGLETRVPFLDNDLVDFAQRVPVRPEARQPRRGRPLNENEPGPKTRAVLRADARRQAAAARGDGALRPGDGDTSARSRGSRRRTRAGSGARASTTCAGRCSTDDAPIYEYLDRRRRARAGRRPPRAAARTAGC